MAADRTMERERHARQMAHYCGELLRLAAANVRSAIAILEAAPDTIPLRMVTDGRDAVLRAAHAIPLRLAADIPLIQLGPLK